MRKSIDNTPTKTPFSTLPFEWRQDALVKPKDVLTITYTRSPKMNEYLGYLSPSSYNYYSPLNPIFLIGHSNFTILNRKPIWTIRDGIVPLSWFFLLFPKPKGFKSKILIHKSIASIVPEAWYGCVGTYETVSLAKRNPKKPKKLLLTGIVTENCCTMPSLEKTIADLKDRLGGKYLSHVEKLSFFIGKPYLFGKEEDQVFPSLYMLHIYKNFGTNVVPINFNYLQTKQSFVEYEVVEFNDRLLCVDSYLLHKPLSQGATLHNPTSPPTSSLKNIFPLSPFHGVRVEENITEVIERTSPTILRYESMKISAAINNSQANSRFPWPEWLMEWVSGSVVKSIKHNES